MCEQRDMLAVKILTTEIIDFRDHGGGMWDFGEEDAIEALVRHGVRPSSLSSDLEHLMALAMRRIATGKADRRVS